MAQKRAHISRTKPTIRRTLRRSTPLAGAASRLAVGFQVSAATLGSASLPALTGLLVARFGLGIVPVFALVLGLSFGAVHELVLGITRRVAVRA